MKWSKAKSGQVKSNQEMGCGSSKSGLNNVDDSVHVMLKHDKKVQQRKGEPVHGYKQRAEHPLLRPKTDDEHAVAAVNNNNGNGAAAAVTATE